MVDVCSSSNTGLLRLESNTEENFVPQEMRAPGDTGAVSKRVTRTGRPDEDDEDEEDEDLRVELGFAAIS